MSRPAGPEWGVLLMAYGTPDSIDDVGAYYTHIRRGRAPNADQLADLIERYRAVGGVTPLREITFAQARAAEDELRMAGHAARVFVGMKHWHPYVAEAVRQMDEAGIDRAVGIVLAPHYSRLSVGQYIEYAEAERARMCPGLCLRYVERWGTNPMYVGELARRVLDAMSGWEVDATEVVFTAHSLPVRIRTWNDPYEAELLHTAELVACKSGCPRWSFAFQSASATGEEWIGPDIRDHVRRLATDGTCRSVVVCPVGFVADHLEILYDLDIEVAATCADNGLSYRRTPMMNSHSALVEAVAGEAVRAMRL